MGVLGWVADSYIIYSSDNGAPPASADVNHQVGTLPGWIARAHHSRPEVAYTTCVATLSRKHASFPRSLPRIVAASRTQSGCHVCFVGQATTRCAATRR